MFISVCLGPNRREIDFSDSLLADEPTVELSSSTTHEIWALFRRIVIEEQVMFNIAGHDPLVDQYVDEIQYLMDGRVNQQK